MRKTFAVALVVIGILSACGGSAPEAPTMTSYTFAGDPVPPVLTKMTVLRPSDGGTVPLGANAAALRLEFTFPGTAFAVQVWVSPDESGGNWVKAGAPLIDVARSDAVNDAVRVAEVPFGLDGAAAVTTRRVRVDSLVEFYEINWK